MRPSSATKNRYNHTASFYETLSSWYSLGKIRASKLAELASIEPTDRVLFAGAGGGEEAVGAAAMGAQVTCIDLAPAMVARIKAKFDQENLQAELICGDIMEHVRPGEYDVVCANYFLNVFDPRVMRMVLEHLVTLLKPGGMLMIADFMKPRGGVLARGLHLVYYRSANIAFWLLSRNALHPVYDYRRLVEEHGLTYREAIRHRLFPGGPEYFQTLVAVKG